MERFMALWRIEHGPARKFVLNEPAHVPAEIVGFLAIAVSPAFLLLPLLPIQLVLPILSIVSFVIACSIALYAHFTRDAHPSRQPALWDFAYAFTLVWIGAGIISSPRYLLDWFEQIALTP
jgi:hypothetical protein